MDEDGCGLTEGSVLFHTFPGGTEENCNKLSVRIAYLWIET